MQHTELTPQATASTNQSPSDPLLTTDFGQPEETALASGDPAFSDWQTLGNDLTLYDRVLISIIAVSFIKDKSSVDIKQYTDSINSEMIDSMKSKAVRVLSEHEKVIAGEAVRNRVEETWIEASKFGITNYLNDFAAAQTESFRDLDNHVRDKTSVKTQAFVAFGVALGLAVFVGMVKPAVTVWDDIKSIIWPGNSDKPAPKEGIK